MQKKKQENPQKQKLEYKKKLNNKIGPLRWWD